MGIAELIFRKVTQIENIAPLTALEKLGMQEVDKEAQKNNEVNGITKENTKKDI